MSRADRGKWQDDAEAWMAFYGNGQRSGGTIMSEPYDDDKAAAVRLDTFPAGHHGEQENESQVPGPTVTPYTATQVFAVLKVLGYTASQADLAMSRAMSRGSWPLSRHVVRYGPETGQYTITPRRTS